MGQNFFMGYKVVISIKLLHGTVWDVVGLCLGLCMMVWDHKNGTSWVKNENGLQRGILCLSALSFRCTLRAGKGGAGNAGEQRTQQPGDAEYSLAATEL